MSTRFIVVAAGVCVLALASGWRANAGTEVVADYGGGAPTYNYASPPPPPPIYYAPPAVGVFVHRTYGYYQPRFCAVRHYDRRHGYWHRHRWH